MGALILAGSPFAAPPVRDGFATSPCRGDNRRCGRFLRRTIPRCNGERRSLAEAREAPRPVAKSMLSIPHPPTPAPRRWSDEASEPTDRRRDAVARGADGPAAI